MKKLTLTLIAAFVAVVCNAQKPLANAEMFSKTPMPRNAGLIQKAPGQLPLGFSSSTRARARMKATAAADLAGDYTWDYIQVDECSTDISSLDQTSGSAHITITASTATEGGITISGMFPNDIEATISTDETVGDYITIAAGQVAGTSLYGDYVLNGVYYYEGDDTYEAGWYLGDIYGIIGDDGVITFMEWFARTLSGGDYDGYDLIPYWVEQSTLTPADPLAVVTPPADLVTKDYIMVYDGGTKPVKVGIAGNDVYFQGMSYYLPEAWVKGTKDGNEITFEGMMGDYLSYGSSFFFYYGETVFTYDAEADTYSAQGQVCGVLGNKYWDGNYTDPVLKPIIEKAIMPANPAITALTDSNYGWYMKFEVPALDINGDGLSTSKLYYMIYTDVEGKIAPLTFTSATHTMLTEDMTEIPFGFTEEWDFYDNLIYLNDIYSEDWNNLGIQSIYYGGDEMNATEIQWYHIKDYANPAKIEATFNFNEMNVPTSTNVTTDGDITEETTLTASQYDKDITLTISPKTDAATTPNRFWSTTKGPQLRVYSGTLTFTAPEGYVITSIVFNVNGNKWADNTADSGEFNGTTWTGNAQTVVVTIAGNSQINSIDVTIEKEGVSITVSDALYATYIAPMDIDFTSAEVSAYAAQKMGTYVHLEPVDIVPAGTAVVVKAEEAGTYRVLKAESEGTEVSLGTDNDLIPAEEDVTADGTQYILAKVDDTVGFYKATPETTIASGKAYIVIESPVKAFYGFTDDDATAIETVGEQSTEAGSPIYNLAGQRLGKMQKGFNIIGGKKVLR